MTNRNKRNILSKIIYIMIFLFIICANICIITEVDFQYITVYIYLLLNILFIVTLYYLFKIFKIQHMVLGIISLWLVWNIFNKYISNKFVDKLWDNEEKSTTCALINKKYVSYKSPYQIYLKYKINNALYIKSVYINRVLYEDLSVNDTILIDYLIKYPQYIRVIDFSPSSEQIRPYLREISNK